MKKEISVIIPFLNEEDNLDTLLKHLSKKIKKDFSIEIVFVDDGSTDNSFDVLNNNKTISFDYKIIKLSKNYGSHMAIRAGINNATYDVCTFMGADLQEPFDDIYLMYDELCKGNDIVLGYKIVQDRSIVSKFFSSIYSKLMKKYSIKAYPKEGVNRILFNLKVKKELNKNIEKNSSVLLQILSLGFKQSSIPVSISKRIRGKSKWTISKKIKLLIDSFVSYSYFPIRLVSIVGILMFLFGILGALYIILNKIIFFTINISGYTSLITALLIGFGITNISLGIIAEYLWRTLDEVRERSPFIIDRKIERRKNNEKN